MEDPADKGPSLDPRRARSTSTPSGRSRLSRKSRPIGDRPLPSSGGDGLRPRKASRPSRSRSLQSLSRSRLRSSRYGGRSRGSKSRSLPRSLLSSRRYPRPRPRPPRPRYPPPRGPAGGSNGRSSSALGPRGGSRPGGGSRKPSRFVGNCERLSTVERLRFSSL